jgi:hypothetical protein
MPHFPERTEKLLAEDDHTLRLATQPLDSESLEASLEYQRVWLSPVENGASLSPAQRHEKAAAALGERLTLALSAEPLCRDFCGRLWTLRQLRLRTEQEKGRPETTPERRRALDDAVRRAEAHLQLLARRHGAGALVLLHKEQDALLSLHQAREALLRSG